jgi:site-specific DNA recombinase
VDMKVYTHEHTFVEESTPLRAAVYVRISRDNEGDELGVDRQKPPCMKLAEAKGAEVIRVFCDNDLSAYSGRPRPEYEEMLQWVREGKLDMLIAWDADRFTRQPRENEDLIDLAQQYGIQLATVTGDYDLATYNGRMHFRIVGAIRRGESEHRAERVRLKHAELRANGAFHGGNRGFGYSHVPVIVDGKVRYRVELHEEEAQLIREAVQYLLRGGSLYGVSTDWNTRGIKRPQGSHWDTARLRKLFITPRIAGLRQNGNELVEAQWPAVIDRDTWEQLRAILGPAPKQKGPKESRTYLLPSILVCGHCGKPMRAMAHAGAPAYCCRKERGGCGRLHRMARPIDDFIRDIVLVALSSPEFRAKLDAVNAPDREGEIAALVANRDAAMFRLKVLRDMAGDPTSEFDLDDFTHAKRNLNAIIEESNAKLAELQTTNTLVDLPPTHELLVDWWQHAPLDLRRAVIRLCVREVILKAPGRGKRFEPTEEHLSLVWRI